MKADVGAVAQKTEGGGCPKCGSKVEYEGSMNVDAWPCIAHPCTCPKCNWEGNEVGHWEFDEMETFKRNVTPLKPLGRREPLRKENANG